MPKAYSYTRLSTPEQLKGDSRRRQVEAARAYADQHGLELQDRYDDIGVSAFKGKNAEFGALRAFIDAVDDGTIEPGSYLIVESIDRLSRETIGKALSLLLELIQKQVVIVTLAPVHVYSAETLNDNNLGLIGALFVMARAHEESKMKSFRLQQAWETKRKKARKDGLVTTSRVPGWLEVRGGQVEVIEQRAQVLREIFEKTRDGWGAYSLSRLLNKRGEAPWSTRANAVWRDSYIKKLIKSRTVLGEYQPHRVATENGKQVRSPEGEAILGYYPAVVDLQLFQEANAALAARATTGRGRKGKAYANLFTGLLRCGCGSGYRYVDKGPPPKGGTYLQCSVSLAKGNCGAPAYRYQLLERVLLDVIESLDARKIQDGQQLHARLIVLRAARARLVDQVETLTRQVRNIATALATEEGSTSRVLIAELVRLETAADIATTDLEQTEREITQLSTLDPEQRRAAVEQLLREVDTLTGDERSEKRRAIASELQRLISRITITPATHQAWEIVEGVEGWRDQYEVSSIDALERLVRERNFDLRVEYKTGAVEHIDGLDGPYFKSKKPNAKLRDMRFVASARKA